MSFDCSLVHPVYGDTLKLSSPHYIRGGTYAVYGTDEAWVNVTFNYSPYYYEATEGDARFTNKGLRGLDGVLAEDSILMLYDMIKRISDKYDRDKGWTTKTIQHVTYRDAENREISLSDYVSHRETSKKIVEEYAVSEGPNDDYWMPTAGNAITALYQLLSLALMRPDGVWCIE